MGDKLPEPSSDTSQDANYQEARLEVKEEPDLEPGTLIWDTASQAIT